jgi:4,5-DOPA dioxygenase extradiol
MEFSALFVSHGSPLVVLNDTPAHRFLKALGQRLDKPKAVIAVSAHWMTQVPALGCGAFPDKINDIWGFPPELFQLAYEPPGAPKLAALAARLLGPDTRSDPGAGLDHAIWSVLSLIWPLADVPVIPMAVQPDLGARHHFELGRRLRPLVAEKVLVLGSGAMTHNLEDYARRPVEMPAEPEVAAFTDWMAEAAEFGRLESLLNYRDEAPWGEHNHPREDHLMPFFVALGAAAVSRGERLHHSVDSGVLAMDAYGFR